MMRYVSTRGGVEPLTFKAAVMAGLARDGGLFMPESVPSAAASLERWRTLAYADLAFEVMRLFADDICADDLRAIIGKSYGVFRHPEVTPVVEVGPVHVLELFHGPTLAFKDVALQFLGNLFEHILDETGGGMNIVAATSGDTGSAAIYGVRGRGSMRIFVMHPRGRVSPVQELQMTTVTDANVHNLAVEGTFDDCQNIVKALFNDLAFRDECALGAVNSINWARVLAQIVYYFYAAFRVMDKTGASKVSFAVPTGNFGDIFAGYVACRMGLPVERLVLATNENDILARYFNSGEYRPGAVAVTLSPSMDIQVSSNFERYLYCLADTDPRQVRQWMEGLRRGGVIETPGACHGCLSAGRGDTAATLDTIREFWVRHNYLLDPHTAVGVAVGARFLDGSVPMICLATAHPAKFGEAVLRATGQDLARHPLIDKLKGLPTRLEPVPPDTAAVAAVIKHAIARG